VHRFDAARVYRLAMERGVAGSVYHAVAEPGIAFRKIAETIATGLGIEVKSIPADQAAEYFTWFAHFAAMDNRASSDQTRTDLNWSPSEPDLLGDMVSTDYFAAK
jgi:nucleoside-diphosphate-sugar epimerase